MVLVCNLLRAENFLTGATKCAAVFAGGDISSVLDAGRRPHVVLDHVPVALLEALEVGLADGQVVLQLGRQLHEVSEGPPFVVLLEGFALGELLQDLEARGQLLGGSTIKSQRRFECRWGHNFNTAVLMDALIFHQMINVE